MGKTKPAQRVRRFPGTSLPGLPSQIPTKLAPNPLPLTAGRTHGCVWPQDGLTKLHTGVNGILRSDRRPWWHARGCHTAVDLRVLQGSPSPIEVYLHKFNHDAVERDSSLSCLCSCLCASSSRATRTSNALSFAGKIEGMTARYGGAQHSTLPTLHSGSRHGHSCGSSADICASQPACKLVPSNIKCCTVPNKLSRRNFGWQFPSMKIRTRRTGDPWNGSC